MNDSWTTLPNADRVLAHASDSRPAWLWSGDGQTLLWHNSAAELFLAKVKKSGLKRAPLAQPIKGQVQRTIRLGSQGRTSLARIQFLAGEKPTSSTCATTPLVWENEDSVLLIVAVDPISEEIFEAAGIQQFAQATAEVEQHEDKTSSAPEAEMPAEFPQENSSEAPAQTAPEEIDAEDASAEHALPPIEPDHAYLRELESWHETDAEAVYEPAPRPALDPSIDEPAHWQEALDADSAPVQVVAPVQQATKVARRLSDLVAKLSEGDNLFAPLTEHDDKPPVAAAPADEPSTPATILKLVDEAVVDEAVVDEAVVDEAVVDEAVVDEAVVDEAVEQPPESPKLFKIVGRGFVANKTPARAGALEKFDLTVPPFADSSDATDDDAAPAPVPDSETVDRVSRYNFDELSRILNDRVGGLPSHENKTPKPNVPQVAGSGALINLGGETLVLNRLPLGILVFRDQQILFANRAITAMVAYESVDALRQVGLGALFPSFGGEDQQAGPINHLVQRDGTLVPVTARLQSISWQGRPALMLSASTTEVRTSHEDAVRDFARSYADLRQDGYVEANRSGVISGANDTATQALGGGKAILGRLISSVVGDEDAPALRRFMERPARFAETARPCLALRIRDGKADLLLFALGQAGIISGYFGFVRKRETMIARTSSNDVDPALLGRISRGVRRPLNTIIGFSDIMRTKSFGELNDDRYAGFADDIARAGQEIAALVDELDDYARLRDGRYMPQRATLDLTSLLESCVIRIREQASTARVIVRNAISEQLPRVTADRASLAQAVLNLLASAIDQTPKGGAVVISAHRLDDGAIAIQVRDSSARTVDLTERFVVFRDGLDRNGKSLAPVRSSVGLALTRSLLAVNTVTLTVDPAGSDGMLFSLRIPSDLIDERPLATESETPFSPQA